MSGQEEAFLDNYDKILELKMEHSRQTGKMDPASMRKGSIDYDRVNISEEMAKTSIWLQLKNSNNERDR